MNETQKKYYLRFAQFAIDCAKLVGDLDWKTPGNQEWGKQLIRSSSSPSANYIEATEALSSADFIYRYGICLKESKESIHWLYLIKRTNPRKLHPKINKLIQEGREFVKIFGTSIETKKKNMKQGKNKKNKKYGR